MKFDELKVEQIKMELTKLNLPTAGNKTELQTLLIDEFKQRGIDFGTYEFGEKEEKETIEVCTPATNSVIELNSMLAAIMIKIEEKNVTICVRSGIAKNKTTNKVVHWL